MKDKNTPFIQPDTLPDGKPVKASKVNSPTVLQFTLPAQLPALLLAWYTKHKRSLPWRQNTQPYHVWLSEIMLQQTRVEAVIPYYQRFLQALPNIAALANADEALLLKLWEGLGYYSRVRNLQKAARQIMQQHSGIFPTTYADILALPGIGTYTAGAIASICFGQPTPAVDGNVLRAVARLCALDADLRAPKNKKQVEHALAAIMPKASPDNGHLNTPGSFNQALMELGATVCLPVGAPRCAQCPVTGLCKAQQQGKQQAYPPVAQKKARREEQHTVLVLHCQNRLALQKRGPKGLLAGMWQLPSLPGKQDAQHALDAATGYGLAPIKLQQTIHRRHIFTHVEWQLTCHHITCRAQDGPFLWADEAELADVYALPTAFRICLT